MDDWPPEAPAHRPATLSRGTRGAASALSVAVVIGGLVVFDHASGFRPSPLLSARRWDKVWQLLCLGPPIVALAALGALWLRCDLLRALEGICDRVRPAWLAVLGLILLIAVAAGPLQRLPGSKDEVEYLFQGRILASGTLWAPAPPCPEAFALRGLAIRDGRWLAAYDPGHPLILGLAHRFGAAWLVGPVCGALSLWLLYLLGRDLWGHRVAMGALCLGVLSPFFMLLAACHSYHPTSLALVGVLLLSRARRLRGIRWDFAFGLALGGLIVTRPLVVAILALPLLVLECKDWRSAATPPWRSWARAAITCAPLVCLYLLYNWAVTGHPLVTGRQMVHPSVLFGFGPERVYKETYGSLGHTPLKGCFNVLLHLGTLSTGLFGWPLVSLLPGIIGFWSNRRVMWAWAFLLTVASTAGILFFSWYTAIDHGPRHYLDAWPGLILLSALGIGTVASKARTWGGVGGANAVAIIIMGLFLMSLFLYLPVRLTDLSMRTLGVDPALGKTAAATVTPPAVVFVKAPVTPADYYCSGFVHNDPWLRSAVVYARHFDDAADRRCLGEFPGRRGYVLTYSPQPRKMHIRSLVDEPAADR